MIVLRTYGADNNDVGATSEFCGISVPVGVRDGDLIIVAITAFGDGVTFTPPDDRWTKVIQTNLAAAPSLAVFTKTAFNEQDRWVFRLSADVENVGGALVYGGVDSFEAVEVVERAFTDSGTSHATPEIVTTAEDSELVRIFGAADAGTYTVTAPFMRPVAQVQTVTALEMHRRSVPVAGTTAASSVAFSLSCAAQCVMLVLRPSVGKLSVDDVRRRLIGNLPAGADQVYDLESGGDYYSFFQSIAEALKTLAYDLVDLLRSEIIPSKSRYKLPDWERIFGLTQTRTARSGTLAQRQAQVKAYWRSAAGQGCSVPEVRGVLAPLLGYDEATPPEVIPADRSAIRLAHTYGSAADITLPVGTKNIEIEIFRDGGPGTKASSTGATLYLTFADADVSLYTFTLTAPDGTSKTWAADARRTSGPLVLYGNEFAGCQIQGRWRLSIVNGSVGSNTLYGSGWLFVEAVGRDHDTAGAAHHWGVYADPDHLGENGTAADFDAARLALRRLAHAHTVPGLILSLGAEPDSDQAVPDAFLPA